MVCNPRKNALLKDGSKSDRIDVRKLAELLRTNQLKPELWQTGLVVSPHGVAINERGDLFVSEFSQFGRVHRFNRQ